MSLRRLTLTTIALLALVLPAAAAAGVQVRGVDASAYPTIRASVVTPSGAKVVPTVDENGTPVAGFEAQNLGWAKAIALVIDRSQSMRGGPLTAAASAARSFVAAKQRADELAVIGFGAHAAVLSPFSTVPLDADAPLSRMTTDAQQGTALYDSIILAARQLQSNPLPGRVIIVLTDGADTASTHGGLPAAIAAAHDANAAVYTIGIEGKGFTATPLENVASSTGGQYFGAS